MNLIQKVSVAAAAVMGANALAGCGLDTSDPTYTPASYYQSVNGVNDCYYVTSPAEVQALIQAGDCPTNSVATLMPVYWEEEYYSYYSSPAYYNTYVPASSRSIYVKYTIVSFKSKYSSGITKYSSKATYKSSAGGTVSGSKVSSKSYGGGSRVSSGSGYGGGSRSSGTKSYGSYGSRK